jgi:TolB-like protein
MLAGEPPFAGPTAQAIIARHLQDRPRSLRVVRPSIPEYVEEALDIALAKVPADRFATALRFLTALKGEGETVSAVRKARVTRARQRRKTVASLAGVTLLLSLGFWKISMPNSPPFASGREVSGPPALSSIAVLYFDDRSPGGKLDYLSAGLTEDLIDRLAAVKGLRVISPDGIRAYRSKNIPLDSLAKIFDIGTIVTGTLRRAGDRLRASVRLVDAGNGVQLFSGDFERPFRDVLELSDEMAEEVARQLRIRLGEAVQLRERRARTRNATAWDLVLQAEQIRGELLEIPTRDSAAGTRLYLEADSLAALAERLDRSWIEPTLLRGWLAYDLADRAADTRIVERIHQGVEHATRALQKSPGAPEALELRGSLLYRGWVLINQRGIRDTTGQLARAERDLRTAASIPHRHQARALSTLSAVLQYRGKLAEANVAAKRAYETDAYLRDATAIVLRLFDTSLNLKRYGEAADWCERGRRTFPKAWVFRMCQLSLMAWSPSVEPNVEKAWHILGELDAVASPDVLSWAKPQMTMIVAAVIGRATLRDSAERVITRAKSAGGTDPDIPYYEALARMRLGQSDEAARLLQGIIRQTPDDIPLLRSEAPFSSLWDHPRLRMFR